MVSNIDSINTISVDYCWMLDARIAYCVVRVEYPDKRHRDKCRIPIKDIGTGVVLRNDRVAVPLFSKGFCLAGGMIPKYLRYYWYPLSILLIQYQQITAGCLMLVSHIACCVLSIPIKDIGTGVVSR